MSLAANPSHLEAVNGVVVGKTKAKQFFIGDNAHDRVMAVLLHGESSQVGHRKCRAHRASFFHGQPHDWVGALVPCRVQQGCVCPAG